MSSSRRHIAVIIGTRPDAIKLAPVIRHLQSTDSLEVSVISSGQHKEMLQQVLSLFSVTVDVDLALMKPQQSLEYLASEAVQRLPELFEQREYDLVLVQGDTSTAFLAALSAFYRKIPVAHVEAGLRTYDKYRPYPEEMNRRLITQIADYHFAPTAENKQALLAEHVPADKIIVTGNTVIDALLHTAAQPYSFTDETLMRIAASNHRILLVTAHRRENFGEPLEAICGALVDLNDRFPDIEIVFPLHLNPQVQSAARHTLDGRSRIHLLDPLDYQTFVAVMKCSTLILTDSGGIQEEAPSLDKPVLVLREKTERSEALKTGAVQLVGLERKQILGRVSALLGDKQEYRRMAEAANPYGDGRAAARIRDGLLYLLNLRDMPPIEFNSPTAS